MTAPAYILTLSCPDRPGIAAAVTGFLARYGGFIVESAQFGDYATDRFFMRCGFNLIQRNEGDEATTIRDAFAQKVAQPFAMHWNIVSTQHRPAVLLMVSKASHCLNTLLHRFHQGSLPIHIPLVVSNHDALRTMVEWYDLPFVHLPLHPERKAEQEGQLRALIEKHAIELVVLARYMQILSPAFCDTMQGQIINIHHSFLPSFRGANPYQQAYDRGVKLIGATAHYVTPDLDEGPIIEQEVIRVDHTQRPTELKLIGQDIESQVLLRAVLAHTQGRVLLNGNKTVVFR